jgi:hypothetical protein
VTGSVPCLDGFAEVARVRVVLKGIRANQHHIQGHTAAPHVSTVPVVSCALQHLHKGCTAAEPRPRQSTVSNDSLISTVLHTNPSKVLLIEHSLLHLPDRLSICLSQQACRTAGRVLGTLPSCLLPRERYMQECPQLTWAGCPAQTCCSQSHKSSRGGPGCHPAVCSPV